MALRKGGTRGGGGGRGGQMDGLRNAGVRRTRLCGVWGSRSSASAVSGVSGRQNGSELPIDRKQEFALRRALGSGRRKFNMRQLVRQTGLERKEIMHW